MNDRLSGLNSILIRSLDVRTSLSLSLFLFRFLALSLSLPPVRLSTPEPRPRDTASSTDHCIYGPWLHHEFVRD